MADTYSDTRVVSILDRRKQLKRQSRARFWRKAWRTGAIFSGVVALGWLFVKPEWQIRKTSQVQILGNQQLSSQTLETFLPLALPVSLLRINPQAIKTALEGNVHAEQVFVTRQLFPPRVMIQLQERSPVALATCRRCILVASLAGAQTVTLGPADLWLLDRQGIPLPYDSYPKLQQTNKVPELLVNNYFQPLTSERVKRLRLKNVPAQTTLIALNAKRQQEWQTLWRPLQASPVKVRELDWQNANNLKLKTDLGLVHLGPLSDNLTAQLRALDQMRGLPQNQDIKQIKSINLENPERPAIELIRPVQPSKAPERS
jgi:cell division protein FtsQ